MKLRRLAIFMHVSCRVCFGIALSNTQTVAIVLLHIVILEISSVTDGFLRFDGLLLDMGNTLLGVEYWGGLG